MSNYRLIHIDETDSTNRWLREAAIEGEELTVVWADYQTAGRGCGTNAWESERGQNLTFSILCHPHQIPANRQFLISMAISTAIADAIGRYAGEDISIKWPNDIYWRDRKLCGILIECTLSGQLLKDCIVGVGLNVNQQAFVSDAPNPVSLRQITGQDTDRELLLRDIVRRFDADLAALGIQTEHYYRSRLYRHEGFWPYRDAGGQFLAELVDVENDGHLLLRDEQGCLRRYAFKEVSFKL
ncbi:MAG: biotin--[Prevotella sp.]|nr:biotin--[acetyl-CoA-carboxylase] ligase [Prevotella sp.]